MRSKIFGDLGNLGYGATTCSSPIIRLQLYGTCLKSQERSISSKLNSKKKRPLAHSRVAFGEVLRGGGKNRLTSMAAWSAPNRCWRAVPGLRWYSSSGGYPLGG